MSAALQSAWNDQATWSETANRLRSEIERARRLSLALLVLGAVLETFAAQQIGPGNTAEAAGGAGALSIAVALALRTRFLNRNQVRDWTRARSSSEALKKEVYLYQTRTASYATGDPDAILSHAANQIKHEVADLAGHAARVARVPVSRAEISSVAEYVQERLDAQIEGYYRPKAEQLARRLAAFRRIETALFVLAAGLGAVAAVPGLGSTAAWVAVATTVTATLSTHVEASGLERSVTSYLSTAGRLQRLRDRWSDRLSREGTTSEELNEFVLDCERAISVENQGWMADLQGSRQADRSSIDAEGRDNKIPGSDEPRSRSD